VGFGAKEQDEEEEEEEDDDDNGGGEKREGAACREEDLSFASSYGEVSKLTFLPASPKMAGAVTIMDIAAFVEDLPLFPYHKILQ